MQRDIDQVDSLADLGTCSVVPTQDLQAKKSRVKNGRGGGAEAKIK